MTSWVRRAFLTPSGDRQFGSGLRLESEPDGVRRIARLSSCRPVILRWGMHVRASVLRGHAVEPVAEGLVLQLMRFRIAFRTSGRWPRDVRCRERSPWRAAYARRAGRWCTEQAGAPDRSSRTAVIRAALLGRVVFALVKFWPTRDKPYWRRACRRRFPGPSGVVPRDADREVLDWQAASSCNHGRFLRIGRNEWIAGEVGKVVSEIRGRGLVIA